MIVSRIKSVVFLWDRTHCNVFSKIKREIILKRKEIFAKIRGPAERFIV